MILMKHKILDYKLNERREEKFNTTNMSVQYQNVLRNKINKIDNDTIEKYQLLYEELGPIRYNY